VPPAAKVEDAKPIIDAEPIIAPAAPETPAKLPDPALALPKPPAPPAMPDVNKQVVPPSAPKPSEPLIAEPAAPEEPTSKEPALPVPPPPAPPALPKVDDAKPKPADSKPVEEPAAQSTDKADLSVVFKPTETSVPLTMKAELDKMAESIKASGGSRVNLVAYASGAEDQASTARRVSLSRALAVRAYLIEKGVDKLAINVQAEGNKNPGGEADRVDVFLVKGEKQ
jgi:outer membrane protein OmpA-like peptidoglycan-associated protein